MLRIHSILVLTAIVLITVPGAWAADATAAFAHLQPVSDARLAQMRGGFSIGEGTSQVQLSLGIDHLTYINGQLAAVSRIGSATVGGVRLVQNGAGNDFATTGLSSVLAGTIGTVIQNSLDNQSIRNLNVINVTVTSRQLANSLMVRGAVRDALSRIAN